MKIKRLLPFAILPALLLTACKSNPDSTTTEAGVEETSGVSYQLTELWKSDTLFLTPESVLYDADRNILFVSNINNAPDQKDDNGFISTVGLNGEIIELRWVEGLSAPKGMGIDGDYLYVTDVNELVVIDIPAASVVEKIPVKGAAFLNDIAVTPEGKVYFSDSNTGKIHVYDQGNLDDWINSGLERPNGLFIEEERILLSSMGSSDLKSLDPATGEATILATGLGAGDGVEFTGIENLYLVSDWNGEVFLVNTAEKSSQSLLKTKDQKINSADIGMNPDEQVVYVPTFFDNRVVAYKLEKK